MRLPHPVVSGFVLIYLSVTAGTSIDYSNLSPAVIATSDFLRRGFQASVVVGNWIYIDGGSFSFRASGIYQYEYSSTLLSIDLSQNWTNATVVFKSTPKPDGVPSLDGPSLWYHDQEGILYAGFTGTNTKFESEARSLPPLSLWTLKPDGAGNGAWNERIDAGSPVWDSLTRPRYPLQAYGSSSAWILGGNTLPHENPKPIGESIVHFSMESGTFENSTVQCCNATNGISGGAMQFVPSFGTEGLFVVLGGVNGNNADGYVLIDFATVSVFDPAKQEWWTQRTTGSEPSQRIQFCTAGISSTNGTYEIFVYAGFGGSLGINAIEYDTISVLTLPAFHWITVPYNPQHPRHGHSCNPVGGSQIISIGGVDSSANTTNADDTVKNTYNAPDPFAQGLAIFDMTTLSFVDQYTADAPPYEQSEEVKQFYAQSHGEYFQCLSPGIAALLQTTHFTNHTDRTSSNRTFASPNGTSASPSSFRTHTSKNNVGVIAGGAAGSAVLALLLTVTGAIVYRSKKRSSAQQAEPTTATETPKEPNQANRTVMEMHEDTRPIELSEQALQELHGQSLQEMEQPRSRVELYAP